LGYYQGEREDEGRWKEGSTSTATYVDVWCLPGASKPNIAPNTDQSHTASVMKQPFKNYFSFCSCLLLFGFVDDIIKGQQHESDFISLYLCLFLFGYLLSLISLSSYLWLIFYWRISGPYSID